MSDFSKVTSASIDQAYKQLTMIADRLAKLQRSRAASASDSTEKLGELETFIREKVEESFAALKQLPNGIDQGVEHLRAQSDQLEAKAKELQEKAQAEHARRKANLLKVVAHREAIAAKKMAATAEPDLTLAPALGDAMWKHFRLPPRAGGVAQEYIRTFDSWISDTPSPESIFFLGVQPTPIVPAARPEAPAAPRPNLPKGFESWVQGSVAPDGDGGSASSLSGEEPPAESSVSSAEKGLNTWLDEANPAPENPSSLTQPTPEQEKFESHTHFEQWLRHRDSQAPES